MCTYRRDRSQFYLKIYNNIDSITISANELSMNLMSSFFMDFTDCSPTGWKESSNYSDIYILWIPNNNLDSKLLEEVNLWAKKCNEHIWLSTNKYTNKYFRGTEIDFCIASDWNFYFDSYDYTECGEAEYQLKYRHSKGLVSGSKYDEYFSILRTALHSSIDCLPYNISSFLVTTIPAIAEKQCKLSWLLSEEIAQEYNSDFLTTTLNQDKPQIKQQTVDNKIKIWRNIYSNLANLHKSCDVRGRDILIVDDLYQSGASIWCYGEFLKNLGANTVIAVTAVKSLRDGDNQ